jgi:hypothetical protein
VAGAPRWWQSYVGRWPSCRTSGADLTWWGADPYHVGSARPGPRDLLAGGLTEGAMPGSPIEQTKLAIAVGDVG